MLSSKFQYAKISKYGTFKFKDFSRTFKGLEFFFQNSRTSQGPYEPCMAFWNTACHKIQLVIILGHSHHAQQTTQYN